MYRLVVTEKPSVGQSIAAALGVTGRKDGYMEGGGWLISWCVGHLAELSEPAAYDPDFAKWRQEDLPILPESWRFTIQTDKRSQFDLLRTLLRREDVSEVVNACDAGREGKLIFRTVYHLAAPSLSSGCGFPAWRTGPFGRASPIFGPAGTMTDSTKRPCAGPRLSAPAEANAIAAACRDSSAAVRTVERHEKTEKAPALCDLTTLQRETNRALGYTAQQTLDYLQALYEKKLCTYPRTDSRFLTDDMESTVSELVSAAAAVWGLDAPEEILASQVCNSKKVSGHHAVVPTRSAAAADITALPLGEREILRPGGGGG